MSILKVEHLSQRYLDKILYLDETFQVNDHDHLGIIGQNGVGKSTLIRILTGQVEADSAQITWKKNLHVGYLDQYVNLHPGQTIREFLRTAFQDLFDQEKKLENLYEQMIQDSNPELLEQAGQLQANLEAHDFYDLDTKIDVVAAGLGVDVLGFDHDVAQLSGGQRSKLILTKLLLEQPDLLLLDEPTNYLDKQYIAWLATYLQKFPGAFVVVSHDDHFLGQIVNVVCDLELGHLTRYTGTLQQARRQKAANQETYLKRYVSQQKQIAKTEAYIRKNKAGSRSKSAKSRERQLAKTTILTPPANSQPPVFKFPYVTHAGQMILEVNNLVIGYEKPLLQKQLNFSLNTGEKVVISGFNGVGKSTLIKTILQLIPPLAGTVSLSPLVKVAYYEQSLVWEDTMATPLTFLHQQFPAATQRTVRQTLARTGLSSEQALEPLKLLSGGEQVKVKLAELMLQPANLLILDEPTNHLDNASKLALQQALRTYPGTVILVTHEGDFYDSSWIDRELDIAQIAVPAAFEK
ncbi:ABC-F family ATP-binding cassette domain-containing protein [Lactobacillus sp. DCY120]|uniref:ABC-F family ATP-binding cassette domain-containing protein n=1 Tax=Bombilactobacillus apium TaxID=2675299 RepID=A0A850R777_9LACO|nr:ATP-binding cassette domain-containing protein [Bombilactobacillus apium]NVY96697.1 ABC-F family ATP-binding cassette domain-containing protein [Bombilactobacillus apium]